MIDLARTWCAGKVPILFITLYGTLGYTEDISLYVLYPPPPPPPPWSLQLREKTRVSSVKLYIVHSRTMYNFTPAFTQYIEL